MERTRDELRDRRNPDTWKHLSLGLLPMNERLQLLKVSIQICAVYFYSWNRWAGPQGMRGPELCKIRRDMVLLCTLYKAERKRVLHGA